MKEKEKSPYVTGITLVDILIVVAALVIAALLFFLPLIINSGDPEILTVKVGERTEIHRLDVDDNFVVSNNGVKLEVEIKDRGVKVISSDCGNGVCVHTGRISRPGQSIVCAPGGISLTIGGKGGDGGNDFIAG